MAIYLEKSTIFIGDIWASHEHDRQCRRTVNCAGGAPRFRSAGSGEHRWTGCTAGWRPYLLSKKMNEYGRMVPSMMDSNTKWTCATAADRRDASTYNKSLCLKLLTFASMIAVNVSKVAPRKDHVRLREPRSVQILLYTIPATYGTSILCSIFNALRY